MAEFGDLSNIFFDTSESDIDYDSSFNIDSSDSYWKSAWDIANTPTGQGLINGVAQGLSSYYEQDSKEDIADKDRSLTQQKLDDEKQTRAAHNASIDKAYAGAKDVKYNGVPNNKKVTQTAPSVTSTVPTVSPVPTKITEQDAKIRSIQAIMAEKFKEDPENGKYSK